MVHCPENFFDPKGYVTTPDDGTCLDFVALFIFFFGASSSLLVSTSFVFLEALAPRLSS